MTEPVENPPLWRWLTVIAVIAVAFAVWQIVRPLATSLVWAAILGFLLYPLQVKLTQKFGNRPGAAAGVITGLTPVAIFGPLTLIGLAFAAQVTALTQSIEGDTSLFDIAGWVDPARHPRIAGIAAWFSERFGMEVTDLQEYVRQNVRTWAGTAARQSGAVFLLTAGVLFKFFIMLFLLFFALRDGGQLFGRAVKLLPLDPRRRNLLLDRLGKVLRAVVYGCGLTALVQGVLVGIGFAIAGLPGYVVFGVLAAISGLLPFGGAGLIWLPGALYLLATGQFGWGIFMLAWGGVVSTSDNFIRPVIISRYTPVPTLLVFIGVIGGVGAFGMLGFVLGPVILVLATELFRFAEGSLKRRP